MSTAAEETLLSGNLLEQLLLDYRLADNQEEELLARHTLGLYLVLGTHILSSTAAPVPQDFMENYTAAVAEHGLEHEVIDPSHLSVRGLHAVRLYITVTLGTQYRNIAELSEALVDRRVSFAMADAQSGTMSHAA
jgi:hypothetical protein